MKCCLRRFFKFNGDRSRTNSKVSIKSGVSGGSGGGRDKFKEAEALNMSSGLINGNINILNNAKMFKDAPKFMLSDISREISKNDSFGSIGRIGSVFIGNKSEAIINGSGRKGSNRSRVRSLGERGSLVLRGNIIVEVRIKISTNISPALGTVEECGVIVREGDSGERSGDIREVRHGS